MFDAVMPTYARYDLAFERGEGAYLWDTDGRRYLDFGAGIAVASLGHCHPHLIEALTEQAKKLWHTSNLYGIPGRVASPSGWSPIRSRMPCSSTTPATRPSSWR